jgi:hypothetical protein
VRTKEGDFWRGKRGTVSPARLNDSFKQNVVNSKVASPAALHDWFQAAIAFSVTWPNNLSHEKVFDLYEYLSCLTEAAYRLLSIHRE